MAYIVTTCPGLGLDSHQAAAPTNVSLFCEQHTCCHYDSVSEWLRRWTRNPLGSARRGSNPLAVDGI